MSLFGSNPKPDEVFTPRSHDLNQRTYADRPNLEIKLKRALSGHKYIIIYGESGNGKTWLYKRVLNNLNVTFKIINLARIHNEGSLNALFALKLGGMGASMPTGTKTEIEGGIKPGGIGGSVKRTEESSTIPTGSFEQLAAEMHMTSGGKPTVLVLDNFEQIVDSDEYVRQVASIIISADDEFVARNNIKVMIVGTPSDIKQMISKVSNANTISNRFIEIPEVARLEFGEARHIMAQGFEKHLKLTFVVDKNQLYKSISYKTDRIAQHVQELCLKIAQIAAENHQTVTEAVVLEAEKEWLEETLQTDLTTVEALMNAQRTKVGRKNQTMYCLGLVEEEDFRRTDIEKLVRTNFSVDGGTSLNVAQILSDFATCDNPIIRRVGKGGKYRFCSPKTKIVIRTKLKLDSNNLVYITS